MKDNYNEIIITEYKHFLSIVDQIGFMPLSNNKIAFVSLETLTREEQWHTGLSSDPWPWRVKIEADHKAAYAKVFEKKPGFISLEWYPVFIAARRKRRSLEDMYFDGLISSYAKQIYALFETSDILATHEIKALCGFTKETVSKYEAAMNELQMHMFITTNGMIQKLAANGEPYGWPATAYSTVEFWAGDELMQEANGISPSQAANQIIEHIMDFIPGIDEKKARKFAGV